MTRNVIRLKDNWKFNLGDTENSQKLNFDDSGWRDVCVPHDWAVEGDFSPDNDRQVNTVIADGITTPIVHEGRTGGLPIVGIGWYRTVVAAADSSKCYSLRIDGAMKNSEVYVNEKLVGGRPYGYTSFSIDITDYMKSDSENVIAIRLDSKGDSSRWYPGAGLYRNVYLTETNPVRIAYNGTYVVSKVLDDKAIVTIECEIENSLKAEKNITVKNVIFKDGAEVSSNEDNISICDTVTVKCEIEVLNPKLWDIKSPEMYNLVTYLLEDGKVIDEYETKFGIRTIEFDKDKGFFLNSKHYKLKGVCMHHDLGALGAAVNKSAVYRQMEIMRGMGCNSIRTSHNPPCVELLDICDELGLVVLDEAFDEWRINKTANGYGNYFEEWAEDDVTQMIKRDRNHPCVIMWSIGNEILDQGVPEGGDTAKFLSDICHKVDPTRPTTAGFNNPDQALKNGLAANVDIVGVNYKPFRYEEFHRDYPDWIWYGSETESTVSSRGEYYFPAVADFKSREPKIFVEGRYHVSSFDMEGPPWATSPEKEFAAQDDCEFILGEYVWTGFDYLGEPTPFRNHWPSHSSYFGIVDRVGLPKDRYYSYKARWTDEDVLHIFPHWNLGDIGKEKVDVHCYASPKFACVELFVNGLSYGVKYRNPNDEYERYRFIFKDVIFEEGQVRAVAYDKDGKTVKEAQVNTAGKAMRIKLTPEKKILKANGEDLCYVKVAVVDVHGNVCPWANNQIHFTVRGKGKYIAADAGDQTSVRKFSEPYCKAFHGLCMAIVSSTEESGELVLKAEAEGLSSAKITILTK